MQLEPAFPSRRAAAAVLVLMLAILAFPFVLPSLPGYDRADKYSAVPLGDGNYRFLRREIHERTGDVDILFMGGSIGWTGIDTSIVRAKLAEKLGREPVVLNFGHNWRGDELMDLLLEELLERRHVKLLVIDTPKAYNAQSQPHVHSYYWWVYGEHAEAMRGLRPSDRAALYAESLLGTGRQLLGLVRTAPLETAPLTWNDTPTGNYPVSAGFRGKEFVRREYVAPAVPAAEMIYSAETAAQFKFSAYALPEYSRHFLGKVGALASAHHVAVATVNVVVFESAGGSIVEEPLFWPDLLGPDTDMIGLPGTRLYADLKTPQIEELYYDSHLNLNGAEFFTTAVTPAILEIYARRVQAH